MADSSLVVGATQSHDASIAAPRKPVVRDVTKKKHRNKVGFSGISVSQNGELEVEDGVKKRTDTFFHGI